MSLQSAAADPEKTLQLSSSPALLPAFDECPDWDLSSAYASIEDPKFVAELKGLSSQIDTLSKLACNLEIYLELQKPDMQHFDQACETAWQMREINQKAELINWDLKVFVDCALAVNGDSESCLKMQAELQQIAVRYSSALIPLEIFELRITDLQYQTYCQNQAVLDNKFSIDRRRLFESDIQLSAQAEKVLTEMATTSSDAWSRLYARISQEIKFDIVVENVPKKLGLAEAAELLSHPDRQQRHIAWKAINDAWKIHQTSACFAINSLVSSRHAENRLRSHSRPVHFLESALQAERIELKTLEAMMSCVKSRLPEIQKALKVMAVAMGVDGYEPWDSAAPVPERFHSNFTEKLTFAKALQQLKDSFAKFHPEMADFVQLCADRKWIQARVVPGMEPGAFSSAFVQVPEPRTFSPFSGTSEQHQTLAHETGHSFHTWVMRDLPFIQQGYPMTLAETASNIGEMLLSDYKASICSGPQLLTGLWDELQAGICYLINIPLRYSFERSVYQKRLEEDFLSADDLTEMMKQSHSDWYGSSMTAPDGCFWMSKRHFYFSDFQFYNFPYTFGYLFAQGVYEKIRERGSDFYPDFVNLLRDTGRMTAEDLAAKHLSVDLTQADFWNSGINRFLSKITEFENLSRSFDK